MKEIKIGSVPSKLRQFELDDLDVRVIERIYIDEWHKNGTVGGPRVWFSVITGFLESQGYEIKKKEPAK